MGRTAPQTSAVKSHSQRASLLVSGKILIEFSLGPNLYTFGGAPLGHLGDWSMNVRKKEKRQNGAKTPKYLPSDYGEGRLKGYITHQLPA